MLHINNIYFEYIFTIIIVLNIIFSAVNALYDTRLKRILVFSSMSSVSIILLG
jgi:NADH:ubiquinone oxidoreductase subunit 2 (subunit N)